MQQKKTAYLLGAGASKACSSETPLIGEFFSRAKQLGGTCSAICDKVCKNLKRRFGLDQEILNKGQPDLEGVFSLITADDEMKDLLERAQWPTPSRYQNTQYANRLEDLIYEVLMTSTQGELNGSGDLYDRLVALAPSAAVFLSFNYDLQPDRALERTQNWSPLDGYGFRFESFRDASGSGSSPPRGEKSQVTLLKLHASLNWLCSTGFFHTRTGVLDYSGHHRGRHFVADCRYRQRAGCQLAITPTFPLTDGWLNLRVDIIPPVWRKKFTGSSEFRPIRKTWKRAREELRTAQRLVVIGYSLPRLTTMRNGSCVRQFWRIEPRGVKSNL